MNIESNIIPQFTKSSRGRPPRYPFHELLPGHTLIVPISGYKDKITALRAVSNAISIYKTRNKLDWETACRTTDNSINVHRLK